VHDTVPNKRLVWDVHEGFKHWTKQRGGQHYYLV
jgi:hypothetical protein